MTPEFYLKVHGEINFGVGAADKVTEMHEVVNRRCLFLTFPEFKGEGLRERLRKGCSHLTEPAVFEENPGECFTRGLAEGVRKDKIDTIIAVGGGSTIDAAKAAAWFACNPDWKLDGDNPHVTENRLRLVAVPTTAGTGSEVTPYAIVTDKNNKKRILNHPSLAPAVAVCDPALTVSMPPRVTAHTGIDALSHAVEAYLSRPCQGVLEDLALASVRRCANALPEALANPVDMRPRGEMMLAALEGGIVLAHCGTVLVHALGYCLTGAFGYPHGLANAILLPAFVEVLARNGCQRAAVVSQIFNGDLLGFVKNCGVSAQIPAVSGGLLKQWAQAGYDSYGRRKCVSDLDMKAIELILEKSMEAFT